MKRGGHATATEVHDRLGDGVTRELYDKILEPLGFRVLVYPHNHTVGAEVLLGNYGKSDQKYRFAQLSSGINPNSPLAALSLMCVTTRHV